MSIREYSKVGRKVEVESASPYELIQMLMQGFLDRITYAKGAMQRKDIPEKCKHISLAISIVNTLKASLNHEFNRELTERLESLYEYIEEVLFKANLYNDLALLDEGFRLMSTIKSGWDQIPEDSRNPKISDHQGLI